MNEVWVTGRGLLTPLGDDPVAFAASLEAQRSGVRLLEAPGDARMGIAPRSCVVAALPGEVAPGAGWPNSLVSLLDRVSLLGLRAAESAWADAGLQGTSIDPTRAGVSWGTGMGGAATAEQSYVELLTVAQPHLHPYTVVRAMNNACAAHVAMRLGLQGPMLAFSNACASAAQAIGEAMHLIRAGRADVVLAGGAEALLAPGVIRAWQSMGVLARPDGDRPEHSCRPFDTQRSGLVLGEGAGALVLERATHARARGAVPLAVLCGYGCSSDAAHLSRPDQAGQVRAMTLALADAGLVPADVGHVNAHGTGTKVGDAVEAMSIAAVFGAHRPAVTATKALHGHLMGAGGAVELIATIEALRRGMVPPSAHVRSSDCEAWIDLVRDAPRPLPLRAALSNSFAFGGTNAVLVVRRPDEPLHEPSDSPLH
jgi:3-oxoacyl-(acyl-carrier-protein) synthase